MSMLRPAGGRGIRYGEGPVWTTSTPAPVFAQPHWQGLPDWHPQPHPEPQPQAPNSGRLLISAGCSVSRSCVGSGMVLGDSAMGPS
jgi:hypothetical protein